MFWINLILGLSGGSRSSNNFGIDLAEGMLILVVCCNMIFSAMLYQKNRPTD